MKRNIDSKATQHLVQIMESYEDMDRGTVMAASTEFQLIAKQID